MRVLFCNVAWMKYYDGISEDDKPINGGKYIDENGEGSEIYNFTMYDDNNFHGFVETKSNKGKQNQLHIERLEGVSEDAEETDNVLVIWCAKDPAQGKSYIVGWYKNATVCRHYYSDGEGWPKNMYAKSEDCVLLPMNKRQKIAPRAGRDGYSYGFGRANVWFCDNDNKDANKYVRNMINYIETYDGENLIHK